MTADQNAKMSVKTNELWGDANIESGKNDAACHSIGKLRWIADFSHETQEKQEERAKFLALLQEGIDSGVSEDSVLDIWDEVVAEMEAEGKI